MTHELTHGILAGLQAFADVTPPEVPASSAPPEVCSSQALLPQLFTRQVSTGPSTDTLQSREHKPYCLPK